MIVYLYKKVAFVKKSSKYRLQTLFLLDITGIAVFIVCSVQSAPTTEIDPGCKVTINQAHQYYSNPCGGLCLHLTRDSVMTQVSNMAGRANKEIASYLSQVRKQPRLFFLINKLK